MLSDVLHHLRCTLKNDMELWFRFAIDGFRSTRTPRFVSLLITLVAFLLFFLFCFFLFLLFFLGGGGDD